MVKVDLTKLRYLVETTPLIGRDCHGIKPPPESESGSEAVETTPLIGRDCHVIEDVIFSFFFSFL